MPTLHSRIRGCLLAGAAGDALGAPVEFLSLPEIRSRYGPEGPADLADGRITDDTQMTLFTAEGVIRMANRGRARGIAPSIQVIQYAYWRWLGTQGERPASDLADDDLMTSWLTQIPTLNARRAPGGTCLSALEGGRFGTREEPLNTSKGCGGVMRVAPVGFVPWDDLYGPFELGCRSAALTHGHPTGWLAAGAMACIVHRIASGEELHAAVLSALRELETRPDSAETRRALMAALDLAEQGPGTAEHVASLGEGWVAEEALAIGVYCALAAADLEQALRLAVTLTGDSDSTGCIAGHILGALHGEEAIPSRWLAQLELRDVIATVADDLYRALHDPGALDEDEVYDWDRYPGW